MVGAVPQGSVLLFGVTLARSVGSGSVASGSSIGSWCCRGGSLKWSPVAVPETLIVAASGADPVLVGVALDLHLAVRLQRHVAVDRDTAAGDRGVTVL